MASIQPCPGSAAATRSSGPKASGSTSRIGTMPSDTVSMSMSAPPCSHSSCRQRPHGISGCPSPPTQATATSRPPPVRARSLTMPHSAHRPEPVRGVLHVAAGDHPAVVHEPGHPDRELRVRRVGVRHRLPGRRPQGVPVGGPLVLSSSVDQAVGLGHAQPLGGQRQHQQRGQVRGEGDDARRQLVDRQVAGRGCRPRTPPPAPPAAPCVASPARSRPRPAGSATRSSSATTGGAAAQLEGVGEPEQARTGGQATRAASCRRSAPRGR